MSSQRRRYVPVADKKATVMMSSATAAETIFVPNVRYHGCPQCGQVWECDACTEAVWASQERSHKDKAGLSSGVKFGAREHAWKKVLYCPECEQKRTA